MNYFYKNINHILKRCLQLFLLVAGFGMIGQIIVVKSDFERDTNNTLIDFFMLAPILIFYLLMIRDRVKAQRNREIEE